MPAMREAVGRGPGDRRGGPPVNRRRVLGARAAGRPLDRLAWVHATSTLGDALVAVALAGTLFFAVPVAAAMALRAALAALTVARTQSLLLYPLAFGLLVCSRAHGISRTAMVPELLDPGAGRSGPAPERPRPGPDGTRDQRDLVAVNGRMARVAALGGTAGALIGVGLDRLVGNGVLYAAALTFTAGTALALSLPRQAAASPAG